MRIDVLTTFPEMFATESPAALGVSIPGRAVARGALEVVATDVRAYAGNKHNKTDDRPFGGGPGMVMMCQPLWDSLLAAEASDPRPATRIYLTPQGTRLTQALVEELATNPRLLLIAGHYEGIDERVITKIQPLEISIGDFVLSGGELAAMILIDAVARLLPGVVGDELSPLQDSFSIVQLAPAHRKDTTPPPARLLDCPHYTKPREWMGMAVPEVLLSGDHGKIEAWRNSQRVERTRERRPDLLSPM
jgi:tRNA (guanine37-N1)-methyltransferase